MLKQIGQAYLLPSADKDSAAAVFDEPEQAISRSDSIYGLSRRINPLQRLFDGHVLRSFDVQLAETPPPIEMRRGRKRLPSNSPIDE